MPPTTSVGFVPHISEDVPWHTAQHIRLLYQKLNNHSAAFTQITQKLGTSGTTTTTIQNFGGGGGGTGSIPGLGGVNNQSGNAAYTTTVADNGVLLVLDNASPVAVTLSTGVSTPWLIFSENLGTGTVTFTPMSGTINSAATFTLASNYSTLIVFDGIDFWATVTPVVPQNTSAVANEFLTGYDATTGVFTAAQPSFTNISGQITMAQLPAGNVSRVIPLGPLTVGGVAGSLTVVDGVIQSAIDPT